MKKYIVTIFVLVFGLGIVGCGKQPVVDENVGVNSNISQNQNNNTNVVDADVVVATTTEEIDISDWRTYRNEEYGFEFNYPAEIEGKKFKVYSNKNIIKGAIFSLAITPTDLGYQDHMLVFNVIKKDGKEAKDFLPSGLKGKEKELNTNFQVGNKTIIGYEFRLKSGYKKDSTFISRWLLIPGIDYDYYMNSGFFEDSIHMYEVINGIIISFKTF